MCASTIISCTGAPRSAAVRAHDLRITAAHGANAECRVWGAEPAGADDARRSLATGRLVQGSAGTTIADGLLAELSERTFSILMAHVEGIVPVDDASIVEAMRFLFQRCKLVVEPSGASAFAAVLAGRVRGDRMGVVLSGSNISAERFAELMAADGG